MEVKNLLFKFGMVRYILLDKKAKQLVATERTLNKIKEVSEAFFANNKTSDIENFEICEKEIITAYPFRYYRYCYDAQSGVTQWQMRDSELEFSYGMAGLVIIFHVLSLLGLLIMGLLSFAYRLVQVALHIASLPVYVCLCLFIHANWNLNNFDAVVQARISGKMPDGLKFEAKRAAFHARVITFSIIIVYLIIKYHR